eukprot:Seg2241.4 transcript_id=Seg2241.4/GoldUCD/mRNA.D3Y31 product="Pyrroline-5-carboxylate reductase 3" protein_id=Seg2241.4/GoldUCD/D3Y31
MSNEAAAAMMECKVGFVGGGKMAQAMAKGFIAAKMIKVENVMASARTDETISKWTEIGAFGTRDNGRVVQECDIVFLCVKPYLIGTVLEQVKHVVTERQLFVSVAAGVPLIFMEENLPKDSRVIRTIPNTPCLVQSGVVAYTPGSCCTTRDVAIVHSLLSSVGRAELVPEPQIDIVASLCGSSVAWFYMMVEGASDGAVKCGLPRKLATELAARALVGAGNMIIKTGKHPGELKDEVTSPAGSTIVGIHSLEKDGMRGSFMSAVEAAFLRNKEMNPKAK